MGLKSSLVLASSEIACVAGVEGEGKGKKRAREVRDEGAREAREATSEMSICSIGMI